MERLYWPSKYLVEMLESYLKIACDQCLMKIQLMVFLLDAISSRVYLLKLILQTSEIETDMTWEKSAGYISRICSINLQPYKSVGDGQFI